MYVIAGLGNPKKEYDNTRHNIGFSIIDMLAEKTGIWIGTAKHKGLLGAGYWNGQKLLLVKPLTYMNPVSYTHLREGPYIFWMSLRRGCILQTYTSL